MIVQINDTISENILIPHTIWYMTSWIDRFVIKLLMNLLLMCLVSLMVDCYNLVRNKIMNINNLCKLREKFKYVSVDKKNLPFSSLVELGLNWSCLVFVSLVWLAKFEVLIFASFQVFLKVVLSFSSLAQGISKMSHIFNFINRQSPNSTPTQLNLNGLDTKMTLHTTPHKLYVSNISAVTDPILMKL